MTTREKYRALNIQINQQLKRAGVLNSSMKIVRPLDDLPNSEWKKWIKELIIIRDSLID